jgi:hypothetical protein
MAATAVTFGATSTITGVATAMTAVIPVAAGVTYNYAYKPATGTDNNRGAQFYASLDGTTTAAFLAPLIVKWEDRAAVQGYVNPQWMISVTGPVDIVIDRSSDPTCSIYSFA